MNNSFLWAFTLALHIISIAYWYGGSIYCLQLKRFSQSFDNVTSYSIQVQTIQRYLKALMHIIPLTYITGIGMLIKLINLGSPNIQMYYLMMFFALVMTILFFLMIRNHKQMIISMRPQEQLLKKMYRLLTVNVLFGLLSILAGAFGEMNIIF